MPTKPAASKLKSRNTPAGKKPAAKAKPAPKKAATKPAPKKAAAPAKKPAKQVAPKAAKSAAKPTPKSTPKKATKKPAAKAPSKVATRVTKKTSKKVTKSAASSSRAATSPAGPTPRAASRAETAPARPVADATIESTAIAAPQSRERSGSSKRIGSEELAIELARLAADDKCTDVVLLDVRGLSPISDFVIVASGTSDRQMRAVADHAEELGAKLGHMAFRSSKDPRALWLLIDFSDVVIHIFEPNTRAHYDIEMMWGDARRIPWERHSSNDAAEPRRSRRTAGAAAASH